MNAKDRGLNNIQTLTLTPNPSPRTGEGSKNLVPLLPPWEKGLGDEGVQSASPLSNSLSYLAHDPKQQRGAIATFIRLGLFLTLLLFPCATIAAPLSEIIQRGRLIVAVKHNLPPLGYRDANGTLQGFEIEIAKRLAKDLLGSEQAVVLQPVLNTARLTAVTSGAVDLAIADLTLTENRMRLVSFSEPYYRNGTGILTQNPKWNTLQVLYRQTVAVLQPSVTLPYLKSALPKARLVGVPSYAAGQQMLKTAQVQAMVGDRLILSSLARQNPQYLFFSTNLTVQPLAIVFPKGVQYEPLRLRINAALRQWQQEGWLETQRQTWGLP